MSDRSAATRAILVAALLAVSVPASAQPVSPDAASPTRTRVTRPLTTTFRGDTGLWFVPTGEVPPAGHWSVSVYRVNVAYEQGFTDVSEFPVSWSVAVRDRLELFGAVTVVTRIDRDVRPLFLIDGRDSARAGGVVNVHPFVSEGWTGNRFGDIWVGGKIGLTSEHRHDRAAIAIRPLLKLPTARRDAVGTGRADVALDGVASTELSQRVELSAFGGFIVRGNPDELNVLNGFRWGVGAAFPTRHVLRLTTEVHGEIYRGDIVQATSATGVFPVRSPQRPPLNASLGLTWLRRDGLFLGAGANWNIRHAARSELGPFSDVTGDTLGFQVRVGYHARR